MDILPYKFTKTTEHITGRAGLVCPAELIRSLNLNAVTNREMPEPGSNRGFAPSVFVNSFVMMLINGGKRLDDIRDLHEEGALMRVLGMAQIPDASTLSKWLLRTGEDPRATKGLVEVNRWVLGQTLRDCKSVTLDIDAAGIECNKKSSARTYKGYKGYMPIIGAIEQTGQVVAAELRVGSASPAGDNVGFIRRCQANLPKDVKVTKLRVDSAGYQKALLNLAMAEDMTFAVCAKLWRKDRERLYRLKDWQPFVNRDGTVDETRQTSRIRDHRWDGVDNTYDLVCQRTLKKEAQKVMDCNGAALDRFEHGNYFYRVIATNDRDLSDSELIHWYNQRGEHSENRIKELKHDFGADCPPCTEFAANALHLMLCALAMNLFVLMRRLLPFEYQSLRIKEIRRLLITIGAKVVHHAREWHIKLRQPKLIRLSTAVKSIRTFGFDP